MCVHYISNIFKNPTSRDIFSYLFIVTLADNINISNFITHFNGHLYHPIPIIIIGGKIASSSVFGSFFTK